MFGGKTKILNTFPVVKRGGGSIMFLEGFSSVGTWKLVLVKGNVNGAKHRAMLAKSVPV